MDSIEPNQPIIPSDANISYKEAIVKILEKYPVLKVTELEDSMYNNGFRNHEKFLIAKKKLIDDCIIKEIKNRRDARSILLTLTKLASQLQLPDIESLEREDSLTIHRTGCIHNQKNNVRVNRLCNYAELSSTFNKSVRKGILKKLIIDGSLLKIKQFRKHRKRNLPLEVGKHTIEKEIEDPTRDIYEIIFRRHHEMHFLKITFKDVIPIEAYLYFNNKKIFTFNPTNDMFMREKLNMEAGDQYTLYLEQLKKNLKH